MVDPTSRGLTLRKKKKNGKVTETLISKVRPIPLLFCEGARALCLQNRGLLRAPSNVIEAFDVIPEVGVSILQAHQFSSLRARSFSRLFNRSQMSRIVKLRPSVNRKT